MNFNKAIEYLTAHHKNDRFAMMIVTEDEMRQIGGEQYGNYERLADLISRQTFGTDDITRNYWYEHRSIFRKLVKAGMDYLVTEDEDSRIRESNTTLTEEAGLEHLVISVDYEIRPLKVINPNRPIIVRNSSNDGDWFVLPTGSTYAEFLTKMDSLMGDAGDHVFYEGCRTNARGDLVASFGS